MTDTTPKTSKAAIGAQLRQQRQAQALRDNLARRKAQDRARETQTDGKTCMGGLGADTRSPDKSGEP